jgi:hypothetical protein
MSNIFTLTSFVDTQHVLSIIVFAADNSVSDTALLRRARQKDGG